MGVPGPLQLLVDERALDQWKMIPDLEHCLLFNFCQPLVLHRLLGMRRWAIFGKKWPFFHFLFCHISKYPSNPCTYRETKGTIGKPDKFARKLRSSKHENKFSSSTKVGPNVYERISMKNTRLSSLFWKLCAMNFWFQQSGCYNPPSFGSGYNVLKFEHPHFSQNFGFWALSQTLIFMKLSNGQKCP